MIISTLGIGEMNFNMGLALIKSIQSKTIDIKLDYRIFTDCVTFHNSGINTYGIKIILIEEAKSGYRARKFKYVPLNHKTNDTVLFLDADCVVFDAGVFVYIDEMIQQHSVLLFGSTTQLNGGFIGVNNDEQGHRFKRLLQRLLIDTEPSGYFAMEPFLASVADRVGAHYINSPEVFCTITNKGQYSKGSGIRRIQQDKGSKIIENPAIIHFIGRGE